MRDATARLYDVDEDRVTIDIPRGIVTFVAKKNRLVDLDKLHESIWATRLSGKTGMRLHWLEVAAIGQVVIEGKQVCLKVAGSKKVFVLGEGGDTKKGGSFLARLRKLAGTGTKVRVSGRLAGWNGPFPQLLSSKPDRTRRIDVNKLEPLRKPVKAA